MPRNKNIERKYHYFYKITNNLNGHFYYGVHNTDNLDDGYMGSGTRLHYAYKKYGIGNFTKEILKFFDTTKEAFDYESEVVNENLIKNINCYNITNGGEGWGFNGLATVKDKNGNTFSVPIDDPRYISGELLPINKNKVTVKDKNGNTFSVSVNDPRYISGELVSNMVGLVHTKDKNGNIFTVAKDDPRYLTHKLIPLYTGTKWTDEQKKKLKEKFANTPHQKGKSNSQYGTKWIYKDNICIKVKKEELDKYINDGWLIGRIYKRK